MRDYAIPGISDLNFAVKEEEGELFLRVSYEAATETDLKTHLRQHMVAEEMRRSPTGQRTVLTTIGVDRRLLSER